MQALALVRRAWRLVHCLRPPPRRQCRVSAAAAGGTHFLALQRDEGAAGTASRVYAFGLLHSQRGGYPQACASMFIHYGCSWMLGHRGAEIHLPIAAVAALRLRSCTNTTPDMGAEVPIPKNDMAGLDWSKPTSSGPDSTADVQSFSGVNNCGTARVTVTAVT